MAEEEQQYGSQPAQTPAEGAAQQPEAQPQEPEPEPSQPAGAEPDYPGKNADKYYTISSRTKGKTVQQMDDKCRKLGINRRQFIEAAVKYAIEEPHGDIAF